MKDTTDIKRSYGHIRAHFLKLLKQGEPLPTVEEQRTWVTQELREKLRPEEREYLQNFLYGGLECQNKF